MASSIDLTNFTEPQFRESQYVLTSPRSLKACANLKIEPVDLLPQSFVEFRRSKMGVKLKGNAAIMEVYEQLQKERRIKLWKAKKEREKIMKLEEHDKRLSSPLPFTFGEKVNQIPLKDQRIVMALLHKRNSLQLQKEADDSVDMVSYKLEKAADNKDKFDQMKLLTIKTKNIDEQERFRRSRCLIEKERKSEEDYLKESLEIKEFDADSRLCYQTFLRNEKQELLKHKRHLRELQRKYTAEKLTAELNEWRENVEELSKLNISRASERNRQSLHEKSILTKLKREEKEFNQVQAMKRLQEEEQEIMESNVQQITQKYKRADEFLKQKNDEILKSHETSQLSSQIRELISDQSNSFNDGLVYAEQHAKFEAREKTNYDRLRHYSNVFL